MLVRTIRLIAPALAFILWAFEALGAPSGALATSGSHVLVDGAGARNGMTIQWSKSITTGPKSSARITWPDGTRLQLDENSGPRTGCDSWMVGAYVGCGWFLIETGKMDTSIIAIVVKVRAPSRMAVYVEPGGEFDIFMIDGHVDLFGPLGPHSFWPNDKASFRGSTRYGKSKKTYGTISPDQRAAINRRFSRWKFPH